MHETWSAVLYTAIWASVWTSCAIAAFWKRDGDLAHFHIFAAFPGLRRWWSDPRSFPVRTHTLLLSIAVVCWMKVVWLLMQL